jgi:hypothetical protein
VDIFVVKDLEWKRLSYLAVALWPEDARNGPSPVFDKLVSALLAETFIILDAK